VTNSVASVPELAAQWHPTNNGDLTPETVVASTTKKLWWTCAAGPDHEWQASGDNRFRRKSGCPFCDGKRASATNSLARFPDLVAEWHPTRNGDLTPAQVASGASKRFWWKCPKGPDHEWQAAPGVRSAGRGCPFCSGRRVSVTNSVASVPQLAAEWHPTRNGALRPEDVVAGTNKRFWWKCPKGPDHEWPATGNSRLATLPGGCPFCRGLSVSVTNSLARFPDLVAEWHPTRNGDLTPAQVVAGSHTKVWWQCSKDPTHEWPAQLNSRLIGRGCRACALPGYNPSKPGTIYVLCGVQWGKVGISNILARRLTQHARSGVFGSLVLAVEFPDGQTPIGIEQDLCVFIAERSIERAPQGTDGYTESFPVRMLDEVQAELHRLLAELPKSSWTKLDHPPPAGRSR
jgi:hypothetical protein